MTGKTSAQIRKEFLDFFREKEHLIVESAPVVPQDDPTLLFINAGMNPFKRIFLGEQQGYRHKGQTWQRVADTQRCIRVSGKHNDLEEVGHDTYHHTLFEMLGNWSFGDYFKREAIRWAWELLVHRWGLEPDRLYATVFSGDDALGLPADDEAARLWAEETPIHPDRILRFGKEDNFWEMGETGPCGPCSEVHIDIRPDEERKQQDGAELVNQDDPRVMEIWNLVFIQFNMKQGGSLEELPAKHVDTGMGFERMVAILQGKRSNYDTDVFTPLLDEIGRMAGVSYGKDERTDIAMRVVADHIRAVSFAIIDGASPANEGRGYVVRRILRRAIRYGWDSLGLHKPFFYKLVDVLADQFSEVFPELKAQDDYVKNVIHNEEKSFLRTLGQGIELFNKMIEGRKELSGDDAFKLHDTYGFPIDLTELMARENGIQVDTERFNELMRQQKERARAARSFAAADTQSGQWVSVDGQQQATEPSLETVFTGYDELESDCRIKWMLRDAKKPVLLLDRTPFYAESGGQVADTGVLTNGEEYLRVNDVQQVDGLYYHLVDRLPENPEGDWQASVDADRRNEIRKHHTATHLMHAALRQIVGAHVVQKGSLVDDNRLRFDFSHYAPLDRQTLDQVEQLVNEKIQQNIPMHEERDVGFDEARKKGAMMLFGEQYGDRVRVVTFDPEFSKELCGGTHVRATGEIGYFRFTDEGSAAAGIRRVEAVTGKAADRLLREEKQAMDRVREAVGQTVDVAAGVEKIQEQKKQLEKQLDQLSRRFSRDRLHELMEKARTLPNNIRLVTGEIPGVGINSLKDLGYTSLNEQPEKTITVLGSRDEENGKVYLVTAVTDDLIQEGFKAGDLVSRIAQQVGGGGGGQPNLATAGGRQPEKLEQALEQVETLLRERA